MNKSTNFNPKYGLFSQNFENSLFIKNKELYQSKIIISEKEKKENEEKYTLTPNTELMEGITIQKFLKYGRNSKFYLGKIESIDSMILIKSFVYTDSSLSQMLEELETVQSLNHDNIITYFDIDIDETKNNGRVLMEYHSDCVSLKKYFQQYNSRKAKNTGLPPKLIKKIIKGVLNGLNYLHSQNIYPGNLSPKNILVNDDLSVIKIINYSMRTQSQRNIYVEPYYSAPKKIFNNFDRTFEYENDIWSVGAIAFELFCGYKPFNQFETYDAACALAQCISPIEAANENLKDLFYDKKNRVLLDFLYKCFRNFDGARPIAEELLEHQFLK